MAILATDSVNWLSGITAEIATDRLFNMLDRHTNVCTHTAGTNKIRIFNSFDVQVVWNYVGSTISILDINGNVLKTLSYNMGGQNGDANAIFDAIILYSPNLLYILFTGQGNEYKGGMMCFMNFNNKSYISMRARNNTADRKIELDDSIYYVNNQTPGFAVKKIADYTLSASSLFFTDIGVVATSNGTYDVIPDFCSCSNTTFLSSVALNNKTYYAIGSNTLVEYTEET